MDKPTWLPFAILLILGTTLAQQESDGDHQDDHTNHDHDTAVAIDQSHNLFDLGDAHYAIVPLLVPAEDGYRGTLVLTLAQGDEAMHDQAMHDEHETMHDEHEGMESSDHHDSNEEHMEHQGEEEHSEHEDAMEHSEHSMSEASQPTAALLNPEGTVVSLLTLEPRSSGTQTAYVIPWFSGAAAGSFDGVWRLVLSHADSQAEVPIAIESEITSLSEVVTVFAPAPSLSSTGLTETFVYAFRGGEPVHAAMEVQRRMPGMQHSTDEERLELVHEHFEPLTELAQVGEAMANRSPLNFAMAGTWEMILTIAGEDAETITMSVQVLSD